MCNSHDSPVEIMTVHDHHWTCPTDNGCGNHIQCGTPESNIPDDHKLHASCWFSEHGCEEADVRKCTHECPFGGTFFNGPEFYVNDTLTIEVVRLNLGSAIVRFKKPGNTSKYGSIVRVDADTNDDEAIVFNIPLSEADIGEFTVYVLVYEEGNFFNAIELWSGDITVKNEESGDSTSNTDYDSSGSNPTPTVPDRPGSFSVSQGAARGSISLSWEASDFDGNSPITDYEYQYQEATRGRLSWGPWSSWQSGGTDMYELITGLNANAEYAIRMRAVNSIGASSVTGQKIIRTRN